jgi:hypothetical protein
MIPKRWQLPSTPSDFDRIEEFGRGVFVNQLEFAIDGAQ